MKLKSCVATNFAFKILASVFGGLPGIKQQNKSTSVSGLTKGENDNGFAEVTVMVKGSTSGTIIGAGSLFIKVLNGSLK